MRKTNEQKPRKPWTSILLLVVLVAYPLSIGPAEWLYGHGLLGPDDGLVVQGLVAFYSPLNWLMEKSDFFTDLTERYAALWIL